MNRKKLLLHIIAFSPDGVSTAYLYNDIVVKLVNCGYEVVVLTTTPHFNVVSSEVNKQPLKKRAFGLYYESIFSEVIVKHVYQKKFRSTLLRILGFLYWHLISFFIILFENKVDLILSPSPPLTIGLLNIILAKIKKAKVIYNVQEIYPDLLIEEGGLRSKPLISFLKWMEKVVYNKSDAVTTIDKLFYNTIVHRFKDKSKLHIIPNFVDTDIYKPILTQDNGLDKNLFPSTKSIKVMYAGNIGHAQDWAPLIKIADELKSDSIEFFVIGEGVMKQFLIKEKEVRGLNNLHIFSYQPRSLMPSLLAYSDVQFIFMSPQTEGHGFPSKVYTVMACAKPLIICSGENTPIVNFLKDKECSFLITEKNTDKKVRQIIDILRDTNKLELEKMGKKGYESIINEYAKNNVTSQYVKLINELLM